MKRLKKSRLVILTLLTCIHLIAGPEANLPLTTAATVDSQNAAAIESFEKFANRAMAAYHVPGWSIALIKDGTVIYTKGFGYRDVERKLPVTPETIFGIASCSKSFTATALGILVNQGKVDWDTPIKSYLPDFAMYDKAATEQLSIRDCLCHRSGLPGYDCFWSRFTSRAELIANLRYLKPTAGFREKYQYNNLMYVLAGHVLETITGMPWEVFVQQYITIPFGMRSTFFSSSVVPTHPNAALAYEYDNAQQVFKRVNYFNMDLIGPACSILSNALDMAQWVIMHLQNNKINSEIHKPQILMEQGDDSYYCFGWFRILLAGDEFVIHRGGEIGISSLMAFIPKRHMGFVVLSNIQDDENAFVTLLAQYAHAALSQNQTAMQKYEVGLLRREAANKILSTQKEAFRVITPTQVAQFVGTYHNDIFGDYVININNATLTCSYGLEPCIFDLDVVDNNTLKELDGEWVFRFERDSSNIPDRFDIDIEEGCPYTFVKTVTGN